MLDLIKEWLLCFYDTELKEFASSVELNNKHCLSKEKKIKNNKVFRK